MSIWTAPFQDPIDEAALACAQAAMASAQTPEERLLQLLKQGLYHTQAESALLLQRQRDSWQILAKAGQPHALTVEQVPDSNTDTAGSQQPTDSPRALWTQRSLRDTAMAGLQTHDAPVPLALIEYSAKIQDTIVLQDARHRGGWTHDPCVQRLELRSILSIPFTQDGLEPPPPKESLSMTAEAPRAIRGVLYLADSNQPDLFRPGRVALTEQLLLQYLHTHAGSR